jgi:hypothetical protein
MAKPIDCCQRTQDVEHLESAMTATFPYIAWMLAEGAGLSGERQGSHWAILHAYLLPACLPAYLPTHLPAITCVYGDLLGTHRGWGRRHAAGIISILSCGIGMAQ